MLCATDEIRVPKAGTSAALEDSWEKNDCSCVDTSDTDDSDVRSDDDSDESSVEIVPNCPVICNCDGTISTADKLEKSLCRFEMYAASFVKPEVIDDCKDDGK